jgi:hypothetical protein
MPTFQTQKRYRAGYFVNEMPVDKEHIGTVLNVPDNMGIPYFIEQGVWGTHMICDLCYKIGKVQLIRHPVIRPVNGDFSSKD